MKAEEAVRVGQATIRMECNSKTMEANLIVSLTTEDGTSTMSLFASLDELDDLTTMCLESWIRLSAWKDKAGRKEVE